MRKWKGIPVLFFKPVSTIIFYFIFVVFQFRIQIKPQLHFTQLLTITGSYKRTAKGLMVSQIPLSSTVSHYHHDSIMAYGNTVDPGTVHKHVTTP